MFLTMHWKILSKDEVVVSWLKFEFVTMEVKSSMFSSKILYLQLIIHA
jgi:hypothetical protein